jgi:hypothetical protein
MPVCASCGSDVADGRIVPCPKCAALGAVSNFCSKRCLVVGWAEQCVGVPAPTTPHASKRHTSGWLLRHLCLRVLCVLLAHSKPVHKVVKEQRRLHATTMDVLLEPAAVAATLRRSWVCAACGVQQVGICATPHPTPVFSGRVCPPPSALTTVPPVVAPCALVAADRWLGAAAALLRSRGAVQPLWVGGGPPSS